MELFSAQYIIPTYLQDGLNKIEIQEKNGWNFTYGWYELVQHLTLILHSDV